MQPNFASMRKQVEAWQKSELTDVTANVVTVHDMYFEPKHEEFRARTIWSLSNGFTFAFKELDPIPQFKATAKRRIPWRPGSHNRSSFWAVPAGPPIRFLPRSIEVQKNSIRWGRL